MLQFFEPPHVGKVRKTVIIWWYWSPVRREERFRMATRIAHAGRSEDLFKATLIRFAGSPGSRRRARLGGWRKMLLHTFAPDYAAVTLDPVSLAIFALDRVGPAA